MDRLDEEYLYILRLIKPHITCIMNNQYIEMIKLWLEKLSEEGFQDKLTRNEYLFNLRKQIEVGELEVPFTQPPPILALQPFPEKMVDYETTYPVPTLERTNEEYRKVKMKQNKVRSRRVFTNAMEDSSNVASYTDQGKSAGSDSSWQDLSDEVSPDGASGDTKILDNGEIPENGLYANKINDLVNIIERLQYENSTLARIVENHEKEPPVGCQQDLRGIITEVDALKGQLHELLDMKSDLQNSHFSVAAEWQTMISTLHKKLANLQRKNYELKKVIFNLEDKLFAAQHSTPSGPQKCVLLGEMHKKEVQILKQKHKEEVDRLEVLHAQILKDQQAESDAKINSLEKWYDAKLQEAQSDTQKNLHEFYEKQVEEVREELEAEMKDFCERRDAELTAEKRKELEDLFKQNFTTLENADDKLRTNYDTKLEEQRAEFEKTIDFKNSEIARLEALLRDQCGRMQSEVQGIKDQLMTNVEGIESEKLEFLQKCIVKMHKLYKRAEREFNRQIVKLRKEIDTKEKHNQILLSTQRVQLISSNTLSKQREMEKIVTNLEGHYKKLIIEQQNEAMREKKESSRLITELREELVQAKAKIL